MFIVMKSLDMNCNMDPQDQVCAVAAGLTEL